MFDKDKIHELYPGAENLMIQPMLIHKGSDSQLKAADQSGEYFAQIKKDGALYMFVKGTNGQTYLFGRTISKKTGLLTEKSENIPHIISVLERVPNETVLLGEIYYPGKTSKDVTSIMGCLPKKAIDRQLGSYGLIHYYIYDCLFFNGTNLLNYDNWTRYQVIKKIYEKYKFSTAYTIKTYNQDWEFTNEEPQTSTIELAVSIEQDIYPAIGKALAAGEEGLVFKKKTGLYEPGKRPTTMLKAKQVDYIDAVIIGFKDPTPQYTGKEIETWEYWVGTDDHEFRLPIGSHYGNPCAIPVTKHYYYGWKNAIEIGAYDEKGNIHSIGTIASGLTDSIRQGMAEYTEKYLHKVVEIQCMMKDNKEKTLRHGFFLRIRDDKNETECKISDFFK